MWESLEIRETKRLCLKMFPKDYKGVNHRFYMRLVSHITLAVFIVDFLSLVLTLGQFSCCDRSSYCKHHQSVIPWIPFFPQIGLGF